MLAFIFVFLVRGDYYTALSYDVIHDVFVLFTFVKVDKLFSDQSLVLHHVLHFRSQDQTFGFGLYFETLLSAKDKVAQRAEETLKCILQSCVPRSSFVGKWDNRSPMRIKCETKSSWSCSWDKPATGHCSVVLPLDFDTPAVISGMREISAA